MAPRAERDAIDRRILAILCGNGRASYQAIADQVGLSRPAAMERVRRLEDAGYITGYAARLNRSRLGSPVTAFVAVRYASADSLHDEPRMRALEQHPSVLECHQVAGDDCYILKVATPSLERLQELLRDVRGATEPGPLSTRTTIVLGTLFEKPGLVPPAEETH
jgi:Lrp/AsnC family leucine-responsive transcriptional regulator